MNSFDIYFKTYFELSSNFKTKQTRRLHDLEESLEVLYKGLQFLQEYPEEELEPVRELVREAEEACCWCLSRLQECHPPPLVKPKRVRKAVPAPSAKKRRVSGSLKRPPGKSAPEVVRKGRGRREKRFITTTKPRECKFF